MPGWISLEFYDPPIFNFYHRHPEAFIVFRMLGVNGNKAFGLNHIH